MAGDAHRRELFAEAIALAEVPHDQRGRRHGVDFAGALADERGDVERGVDRAGDRNPVLQYHARREEPRIDAPREDDSMILPARRVLLHPVDDPDVDQRQHFLVALLRRALDKVTLIDVHFHAVERAAPRVIVQQVPQHPAPFDGGIAIRRNGDESHDHPP